MVEGLRMCINMVKTQYSLLRLSVQTFKPSGLQASGLRYGRTFFLSFVSLLDHLVWPRFYRGAVSMILAVASKGTIYYIVLVDIRGENAYCAHEPL